MSERDGTQSGVATGRDGIALRVPVAKPMPAPWHSPTRWIIACGVLLIITIAIGTAIMVAQFRDRALQSSAGELSNTVLLVSRHFDQQFDDLQAELRQAADALSGFGGNGDDRRRALASEETYALLKSKTHGFGDVTSINVYDATGKHVNSSDAWPVPRFGIEDRNYFKEHRQAVGESPTDVEVVKSRVTGAWSLIFSRRITGSNGEFLGVVTRSVTSAEIESFFASVTLGDKSSIVMYHRDGTMAARHPPGEGLIGRNFAGAPLLGLAARTGRSAGVARVKSPIDAQSRIGAVINLANHPLLIAATTTVDAALADWRHQTHSLIVAAGSSALIISAMLYLIVRHISRQHVRSRQRLALEKQRLDTAVNNMSHGLLLFDASGRLIVCNHRYLDMFGLSDDVVKPGCTLRELLMHRKTRGGFESSIDEHLGEFWTNLARGIRWQSEIEIGDSTMLFVYTPVAEGGWVTTVEDITERKRSANRIEHLAHYDALTDLPNRTLFRERLESQLANMAAGQCAVLYIDVDEFKSINDALGHPAGDELLKVLAGRLRNSVGENGFVARLGGDEFAIVQTGITRRGDVVALVNCVHEAIRWPCDCLGHQISTDASIGIAIAPGDGTDLDQLLKHADLAMYAAKSDGRRTHRFFEPVMDEKIRLRQQLEQDLRQLVNTGDFASGGFEVYYQPLVALRNDEVTGCEALLRWRHPQRGPISPGEFIPLAEDTGMIAQLGDWVLATACSEAVSWPKGVKVAVNVSPVQFRSRTLPLSVAAALGSSGLAADRLELEITEAVLIDDVGAARDALNQLRALGVRTALDDFGTGYSSLSYLQSFPFDKIKIDRCFINEIVDTDGSSSIVQAVVTIAASRRMITTAEGVETEIQRDRLRELGCTEMQGFLFSPPLPAEALRKLLLRHRIAAA